MDKLEWSALEYDEKERSSDWFWALGIIVVTSSIASIIYGNYFFAVLLVLSGALLGYFAIKKPDVVLYELNNLGLLVRSELYRYEHIKSFWVQVDMTGETNLRPTLFVKTERFFMPVMSIPIYRDIAPDIQTIMLSKNVIEEQMKEHSSSRIMEVLGF